MAGQRHILRLAHSPDPDDVFMWWPITGKVTRAHGKEPERLPMGKAVLDTGRFVFQALPMDIEVLNRRAVEKGDLEITALSLRTWNDVSERYRLTKCGSSFGDGYGPKIVSKSGGRVSGVESLTKDVTIAVPGKRTTAFMVMSLLMGKEAIGAKIAEMPFDQVITAVVRGEADAGLLIHEGQVTYEKAGLKLVVDVGAWWKERTGLPLPLGVNVVRRDLDAMCGEGTVVEVASMLRQSLDYALKHREESLDYAMTFALESPDGKAITRERVDAYIDMYVNKWTVDMGAAGVQAVEKLLGEGAARGLCPAPKMIDPI